MLLPLLANFLTIKKITLNLLENVHSLVFFTFEKCLNCGNQSWMNSFEYSISNILVVHTRAVTTTKTS